MSAITCPGSPRRPLRRQVPLKQTFVFLHRYEGNSSGETQFLRRSTLQATIHKHDFDFFSFFCISSSQQSARSIPRLLINGALFRERLEPVDHKLSSNLAMRRTPEPCERTLVRTLGSKIHSA